MNIFIFDARVCLYSVLSTFPALRVVLREAIGCPKAVPLKKIVVVPDNEPSRYKNLKRTKAADSISFSLHIYHTKYGVIPLWSSLYCLNGLTYSVHAPLTSQEQHHIMNSIEFSLSNSWITQITAIYQNTVGRIALLIWTFDFPWWRCSFYKNWQSLDQTQWL